MHHDRTVGCRHLKAKRRMLPIRAAHQARQLGNAHKYRIHGRKRGEARQDEHARSAVRNEPKRVATDNASDLPRIVALNRERACATV